MAVGNIRLAGLLMNIAWGFPPVANVEKDALFCLGLASVVCGIPSMLYSGIGMARVRRTEYDGIAGSR
jgi:hypothetical protein